MEGKRLLPEQFFKYVTEPISREDINLWVKINNINTEKTDLFSDYILSLYDLVSDTYLGSDVIKYDKEKTEHFDWCWNKTLNNFQKENITFNNKGEHYDYFWEFFYESFYNNKNQEEVEHIVDFFTSLFQLHITKTKSELDMLTEIYNILDTNLTVSE